MKIGLYIAIAGFLAFNNAPINSHDILKERESKQISWEELEAMGVKVYRDSTRNTIILNSVEEVEALQQQGFTFIKPDLPCDYYYPSDAMSDSVLTYLYCISNNRWIAVHKTNNIPKYGIISDNFGNVIDTVNYYIDDAVRRSLVSKVRMPDKVVISITNVLTGKTILDNANWSDKDPYGGTLPPQFPKILVKGNKHWQVDCDSLVSGYYFISHLCPDDKERNIVIFKKK